MTMFERINTRGSIIVSHDSGEEQRLAREWFAQFGHLLTYRSEDHGCHCCMNLWDVEGPEDAIAGIPERISIKSSWTHPGPPEQLHLGATERVSDRVRRRPRIRKRKPR